ncbi:hypothetical protein TNCV_3656841 [Trichonephila clavipes]|nr:hypothetical protein TNCV_3656841 [Trichonephila clavipes]
MISMNGRYGNSADLGQQLGTLCIEEGQNMMGNTWSCITLLKFAFALPRRWGTTTGRCTIIFGAKFLCRYQKNAGNKWSPRSLQARIWASEYCTQNLDSSKKTTLCQSRIQLFSLVSRSLCWTVKKRRSNGRRDDSQSCCKRRPNRWVCCKYFHLPTNGP